MKENQVTYEANLFCGGFHRFQCYHLSVGDAMDNPIHSKSNAMGKAVEEGWIRVDGCFYCPSCAKKLGL